MPTEKEVLSGNVNAAELELARVKAKSNPTENEIKIAENDVQNRQADLNRYLVISELPLAP